MNIFFIIAVLVFLWAITAIAFELARSREVLTERLGSIAEALWRIRDELSEIKKRKSEQ